MNIVVDTNLPMEKDSYTTSEFLSEIIEKYEHFEDDILGRWIQTVEQEETLSTKEFFSALDHLGT